MDRVLDKLPPMTTLLVCKTFVTHGHVLIFSNLAFDRRILYTVHMFAFHFRNDKNELKMI